MDIYHEQILQYTITNYRLTEDVTYFETELTFHFMKIERVCLLV